MEPRHEVTPMSSPLGQQEREISTPMPDGDPTLAMGGASPADMIEPEVSIQDNRQRVIERAKQIGRTTIDTGTKLLHTAEDKLHEIQDNRDPHAPKVARYAAGAGAIAIASGVRIASRKRHQKHELSTRPQTIINKAKDLLPTKS